MEQESQTLTNVDIALYLTDVAYKAKSRIPLNVWTEKTERVIVQSVYDTYRNFLSLLETEEVKK